MIPIKFSIPEIKPIYHVDITKKLAVVLPNDTVSYEGNIYNIANCSKSVNGLCIYYLHINNESKLTKIMSKDKVRGELYNASPYRTGLTVSGYIDNNEFVICNIIHSHMNFTDIKNKVGLIKH